MNKNNLKILQLGKFYPIRGGIEKVAYDLTVGLSEQHTDCDMMCAAIQGGNRIIPINEHARIICCHTWMKAAATMISPAMVFMLRKMQRQYDIIHVHHPDPMACLALFLSGYKGRVILHWHSDILKQQFLLKLYKPLQQWLIRRADLIIGTSPVYLAESPFLQKVQEKTVCLPIGIAPVKQDLKKTEEIRERYRGKKIVFSLGRLVPYKGYRYLINAAKYLDESYVILIGGTGPLKDDLQKEIEKTGLKTSIKDGILIIEKGDNKSIAVTQGKHDNNNASVASNLVEKMEMFQSETGDLETAILDFNRGTSTASK